SLRFYREVFGVEESFCDETQIHVKGPGPFDVLAFERRENGVGARGGIDHFGFRLVDPADIDAAIEAVVRAGGRLWRRGEFAPGFPSAYAADRDGYGLEIWFA